MSKLANLYWSPDYKSGIDNLNTQLLRSLSQLHELRKLIFNYMKLYHSNGEYLAGLSLDALSSKSAFNSPQSRQKQGEVKKEVNLSFVLGQYKERSLAELHQNQALASDIDRLVLEKVTSFIKHHEPQILRGIDLLAELFADYESYYRTMEKIKNDFDSGKRSLEFSAKESGEISADSSLIDESVDTPTTPNLKSNRGASPTPSSLEPEQSDLFSFPLSVGNVITFSDISHFRDFFSKCVDAIDVTRRAIPLPGYRNEIFSSQQLCDYFQKGKSAGFNPSRSNLERFGQGLIDLKIIVGTGFFAKKFASEGKWYEWSGPFLDALIQDQIQSPKQVLLPSLKLLSLKIEDTHQYVNEMALSTSKKFNGMLQSMKSSFLKPRQREEVIKILEKEYNDTYNELQKTKHLLDVEISDRSNYLETFEKLKIEVIYRSLTKLLEVIYGHSLKSVEQMHDFTQNFVSEFNKSEHYENDFESMVREFSCGIYFPSNVAPEHIAQKNFTGQLNTNFQNISIEFNLFKDIPLQLNLSNSGDLLTNRSIPKFLFEAIKLTELDSEDFSEIKDLWVTPLNHQSYWLAKNEIITAIQNFIPGPEVNIHSPQEVDGAVIDMIIENFKRGSKSRLVNFLKNWCLEIGDSIIPSTVFDSLIGNYTQRSQNDHRAETIRILTTIPRANLSSLVHILEHISKVNGLDTLQGFGETDDVTLPESLNNDNDMAKVSESLNRMQAIGSVPLLHLIMRPSIAKNSSGFIPPFQEYNRLLLDLLEPNIRFMLLKGLLSNEKKYIERQELQKKNLGIIKKAPEVVLQTSPDLGDNDRKEHNIAAVMPRNASAPKNNALLNADNFELRPFRTGTTPRSSPLSSPIKRNDPVDPIPRSTSASFLTPIDITLHGSP